MQRTAAVSTAAPTAPPARVTATLLAGGVIAGPIYLAVGLVEALTRPGFDLTRHSLSLLANGELGGVHVVLLVTTGLLTIAGALGLRRALVAGRGRTWDRSWSASTAPASWRPASCLPIRPSASRPGRPTAHPRRTAGTASVTSSPAPSASWP